MPFQLESKLSLKGIKKPDAFASGFALGGRSVFHLLFFRLLDCRLMRIVERSSGIVRLASCKFPVFFV